MSKIAIVRPPQILPVGTISTNQGVPSIGIAYLVGSLKAAGHQAVVIDALGEALNTFSKLSDSGLLINGLDAEEIVDRIPDDVDVIGVSCMYSNEWLYSKVVVEKIIERFPHTPIVAGGEHVSAEPEYTMQSCPGIYCCVMGEGEETFVELVGAINAGTSLNEINGVAFLDDGGSIVCTPPRKRIKDIDNIPLPSWDESPLENYLSNGLGMSAIRGRNMPMIASRGCPYKCTFCSNPIMWEQKWYARDPKLVVDELKVWKEKFQCSHFEFYDLTTIVRKDWIVAFTDILLKENLQITWALPSGTRSEALDEEVLNRLKQTGCNELCYAPESGSPVTLKRIKKQVNLPRMLDSMRAAVKAGISVKSNMIVGFPEQTKWEVFESYRFMLKMAFVGTDDTAVFPFVPYPGSALFLQLVSEGKIQKTSPQFENFLSENIYNEVSGMKSWSEHISDHQIKLLTVGGMAWFYFWSYFFRPWRVFRTSFRLITSTPKTMIERALDGVIRNFVKRRKLNLDYNKGTS